VGIPTFSFMTTHLALCLKDSKLPFGSVGMVDRLKVNVRNPSALSDFLETGTFIT